MYYIFRENDGGATWNATIWAKKYNGCQEGCACNLEALSMEAT